MLPVKVRGQTLKIFNYSKNLDVLTDEARWQQSVNIQLLSLFQGKSQVLWRKEKHNNLKGIKTKTYIHIHTHKVQQIHEIKNEKSELKIYGII